MTPLILLAAVSAEPGLAEDYARAVEGSFSSEAQHRADPRYDWVEARVVRIWPERTDGVWLYQEQAIVSAPGLSPMAARAKPYFQFVARVTQIGSGVLRRDNFRVKDGAAWLGLTAADPRLARLSQADLAPPSCHNRLEKVSSGVFTGRTESCANSYKGAAWMQSLSVTMADVHVNWDRGFDLEGNRVWGPAAGGYVFRRKSG